MGVCLPVWGHSPEGITFLAFQWPPGQEPLIDGDLSEWEIVPEAYILNTQDGYDGVYGASIFYNMTTMEDPPIFLLFAVVWTSWSDAENALYVAARVFDDEHFILGASDNLWKRMWQGDHFDVSIDADHSGGPYSVKYYLEKPLDEEGKLKREFWDIVGVQATSYFASWSAPEPFLAETAAIWMVHSPWFEGGVDYWDGIIPERLTGYERGKLEEFKGRDWLATDWRVQATWRQIVKEGRRFLEEIEELTTQRAIQMAQVVRAAIDPEQEELKAQIQALGGKVYAKLTVINALIVRFLFGKLDQIADLPLVGYVEKPPPAGEGMLDNSTQAILAQTFWNNGYKGAGQDFGIVDDGINGDLDVLKQYPNRSFFYSPDSTGYTTNGYDPVSDPDDPFDGDHGTAVAAVPVATGYYNTPKGVAYEADDVLSAGQIIERREGPRIRCV